MRACVCVCVLVYATLWGTNVPTMIVKPDIFCLSIRARFRVVLGDRKYSLVSIKVIEVYVKSPQFTETNVCVCVCVCVWACLCGL